MIQKRISRVVALLLVLAVLAGTAPVRAQADQLSVERQVYAYLTEQMGFSTAAACGILANIEHESSFQPTIVGDQGTSYGLCQWHNERWTALRNYCRILGLDYRTVEGQMEYLNYELGNNYSGLFLSLKTVDNSPEGAYRAAYLWCVQFERPSNMEVKAVNRGNLARGKYWSRYNSYDSVIMIEPEIQPEEPSPEVIIDQLRQNPVTIPLPPEEQTDDAGGYEFQRPEFIVYTPWHLPMAETEVPRASNLTWGIPALAGIALLAAATVWFPSKKRR